MVLGFARVVYRVLGYGLEGVCVWKVCVYVYKVCGVW